MGRAGTPDTPRLATAAAIRRVRRPGPPHREDHVRRRRDTARSMPHMPHDGTVSARSSGNGRTPGPSLMLSTSPLPAGDVSVKYSMTALACPSVRETLSQVSGSKPSATIGPCSIAYGSPPCRRAPGPGRVDGAIRTELRRAVVVDPQVHPGDHARPRVEPAADQPGRRLVHRVASEVSSSTRRGSPPSGIRIPVMMPSCAMAPSPSGPSDGHARSRWHGWPAIRNPPSRRTRGRDTMSTKSGRADTHTHARISARPLAGRDRRQ